MKIYKLADGLKFFIQEGVAAIIIFCIILPPAIFFNDTKMFDLCLKTSGILASFFATFAWFNVVWIRENCPTKEERTQLHSVSNRMDELELANDEIFQENLKLLIQLETFKEALEQNDFSLPQVSSEIEFRRILQRLEKSFPKIKDRRRNERLSFVINRFVDIFITIKPSLGKSQQIQIDYFLSMIRKTNDSKAQYMDAA